MNRKKGANAPTSNMLFDNFNNSEKTVDENSKRYSNHRPENCSHDDTKSQSSLYESLIWDVDEVASFTSYSKGTIYNLVHNGEIPYRKERGRLWFIPKEILRWMKGEL